MLPRMPVLRLVAAAHVAAAHAQAQMHPRIPDREALLAAVGGVGRDGLDGRQMCTGHRVNDDTGRAGIQRDAGSETVVARPPGDRSAALGASRTGALPGRQQGFDGVDWQTGGGGAGAAAAGAWVAAWGAEPVAPAKIVVTGAF